MRICDVICGNPAYKRANSVFLDQSIRCFSNCAEEINVFSADAHMLHVTN